MIKSTTTTVNKALVQNTGNNDLKACDEIDFLFNSAEKNIEKKLRKPVNELPRVSNSSPGFKTKR